MCVFADVWGERSFQTDPDLPPGWKMMTDMAGIYYWHIPTGTTQWERPGPCHPAPTVPHHDTRKHSLGSLSPSPTPDQEVHTHTHTFTNHSRTSIISASLYRKQLQSSWRLRVFCARFFDLLSDALCCFLSVHSSARYILFSLSRKSEL